MALYAKTGVKHLYRPERAGKSQRYVVCKEEVGHQVVAQDIVSHPGIIQAEPAGSGPPYTIQFQ